ncbi:MAG TPA: hypothetical protein VEW68_04750, partial [Patescibacteria group bacterium]|nr:hypothetical protein [Patescibacteria group bacterium]
MSRRGGGGTLPKVGGVSWLLLGLCALDVLGAAPSMAATRAPHWSIVSQSEPTYFKAGDTADAYRLTIRNDGGLATTHG